MTSPDSFFVDANIPMYAEGRQHPLKASCARALGRIAAGGLSAYTSAEVLQEILHRYLSIAQDQRGRQIVDDFATLVPDVLPLTKEDVLLAARLSSEYPRLPSRDLIHLAVMQNHGIEAILTADTHFDNVAQVRRIDPGSF